MTALPAFGPWSPALSDPVERKAQLRALAMLVRVFGNWRSWPTIEALRLAEDDDTWLPSARTKFDGLPTLTQRNIIGTFAAVMAPPTEARRRKDAARAEAKSAAQEQLPDGPVRAAPEPGPPRAGEPRSRPEDVGGDVREAAAAEG